MLRSPSELLRFMDAAQVAITVGALVDLALPWWSYVPDQRGATVVLTGWNALSDGTYGNGWGLLGAVLLTAVATALRRRWAAIAGLVIAVLGVLVVLVNIITLTDSNYDDSRPLAGANVGLVLTLLVAGTQAGVLFALKRGGDVAAVAGG